MDMLLIDPPYKSLKGIGVDCAYAIGLVSLAGYLAAGGIETMVLTGDLLTDTAPGSILDMDAEAYARGQAAYKDALLDDGHPIWTRIASAVREAQPKAVGLMYLTPAKPVVEKVADLVKQVDAEILVVVGAHHPSFRAVESLQNKHIDFAVRGEGEIALLALAREIISGRRRWSAVPSLSWRDETGSFRSTAEAALIRDLDTLPLAARDRVWQADYQHYRTHFMYTARGCPYSCAFCSDSRMWGHTVRRRSAANAIAELRLLKDRYDPAFVDFSDGTFTYDPNYVQHFCERLTAEDLNLMWRCTARYDTLSAEMLRVMKQANCFGLYLGLESGSTAILEGVNKSIPPERILEVSKMIRDSGLVSMASVLLGLPEEKPADVERTLALMRQMDCDLFDINCYVPLPGTPLGNAMDADTFNGIDWLQTGFKSLTTNFSNHMTNEEFQSFVLEAYRIAEEARARFLNRLAGLAD